MLAYVSVSVMVMGSPAMPISGTWCARELKIIPRVLGEVVCAEGHRLRSLAGEVDITVMSSAMRRFTICPSSACGENVRPAAKRSHKMGKAGQYTSEGHAIEAKDVLQVEVQQSEPVHNRSGCPSIREVDPESSLVDRRE